MQAKIYNKQVTVMFNPLFMIVGGNAPPPEIT